MIGGKESALQVTPGGGIPGPPGIAARLSNNRRKSLSRAQYVEGILGGDRVMLAQAITLIESSRPADRETAEFVVEQCLRARVTSLRLGITGVPGAGKSTLIETLGNFLISEYGQKVAVLAVDPSSERTGGSILGDKTRMVTLGTSEKAFIRPSPSRGSFGGVAQRTREAMLLCEAAGYRNIMVETVGIGQSETAVHNMVDFFLLVTLPGGGDELQGIKRGVMEIADLVVVNKADGENVKAAERAVAETGRALHLLLPSSSGWRARAIACSAVAGRGIGEIWKHVLEHAAMTHANGWFDQNRREQRRRWMEETLEFGLRQIFRADPLIRMSIDTLERQVLDGETTPFRAARTLLEMYSNLRSGRIPKPDRRREAER